MILLDRHEVTRANNDIKFMINFVKILQANYPERLAQILVIESNWLFRGLFMVVKPFLA